MRVQESEFRVRVWTSMSMETQSEHTRMIADTRVCVRNRECERVRECVCV